jgi:hypothetical protein
MATTLIYSEVTIANMALERIGAQSRIQSLDTTADTSQAAASAALWYPQSRDHVLTEFPWRWAMGSVQLSQYNTQYPATPQFEYAYIYPPNVLDVFQLVPTVAQQATPTLPTLTPSLDCIGSWMSRYWRRPEGQPYPWDFQVGQSADGQKVIATDLANATALAVMRVTDPTQFSADFADIVAWKMAVDMAFSLAISRERREDAVKEYEREVRETRARMQREYQSSLPLQRHRSEFVRARM